MVQASVSLLQQRKKTVRVVCERYWLSAELLECTWQMCSAFSMAVCWRAPKVEQLTVIDVLSTRIH